MQEEELEEVEYKDITLTDLVHVSNNINYFMINIKEEQIQNLVDRLKKIRNYTLDNFFLSRRAF